ncbi:MAG TPA: diacylglycerol kinase [Thermodesulfobium narugense]|uniref:Undecaprenol kinase/diacylglycerol kinase (ATP) n=1 Tax=Thermodesulfobium acidiphilum TaxID=1794699 RepID=A0A2R4W275_THEAF|nr:diacylglycerol kinase [Thermodesulfobium acidiphilum]AWB10820.1 undecaprenol kinase/diacylglycerol kinase (ATP) [Thermodesulfobium acidiphilum]PMP86509.1 MAG: diacylglycerol kinase [Thermodesulfobium narugense]HEM56492.1 diacylglycerol kinase [Thermodesulfobium narugense]
MKRSHNIYKSFYFAIMGLLVALKEERNLKIQLGIFFLLLTIGFILRFEPFEWTIVLLSSSIVIVSEMINSVIERIMDYINPEFDDRIKTIKDMSASFVLIACLFSIIIFLILILNRFAPYIFGLNSCFNNHFKDFKLT